MEDASMLTQDPVDGTRRTGQAHPRLLEILIARQIVQDRLGPWRAPQSFGGLVADLEDAIDDLRI
jgi:hypothetical protein